MQINSGSVSPSSSYSYKMNTGGTEQDEQIKSLQQQIENVQKQLQSLSENKNISPEEKMEKKKELQQRIQEINKQISQRKIEIQREKREAARAENQTENAQIKVDENKAVMGAETMQGLVEAESSMKQIHMVGSVKADMEGRAKVLEIEIETDKGRGGATEKKEEALSKLKGQLSENISDVIDRIPEVSNGIEKVEKPKETTDSEPEDVNSSVENQMIYDKSGKNVQSEVEQSSEVSLLV